MARRETRGSSSPTSPSKRLKTLTPPPVTKDTWIKHGGDSDDCCGICLSSENWKTIRGEIDSCNHYFCFLCIVEWAKVETRCPLCKQRFSSIRRPPKDGVFSTERIVTVPPRDQADDSRSFDPYAETKCCVCHGTEDECFLLLCDLCDSAAHTFCVGLGHTVPTGDWFCRECTIMKEAQADAEESGDGGEQSEIPAGDTHVSVPRIMHLCSSSFDSDSRATRMTRPLTAREIVSDRDPDAEETCPRIRENTNQTVAANVVARTRHQCRDVHNRIQTLRNNWDSFRRGSANFAPTPPSSSGQENSGNPSSSGSKPDVASLNKVSFDVERAWKMLDIAKYRAQKASSSSTSVLHRAAPSNSTKASGVVVASMRQPDTHRRDGGSAIALQAKHDYVGSRYGNSKSPTIAGKRSEEKYIIKRMHQSRVGIRAESSSSCSNSQGVGSSGCSSAIVKSNPKELVQGESPSFTARPGPSTSSSIKLIPKEECKSKEASSSSRGPDDGAKCEIQSLVKLNLKLLTRNKRLGVDLYKGIARDATHTILAACNLEHKKSHVHDLPSPVCLHTNRTEQLHESTLMPNTCRDCFDAFVKTVVDSVMQEKVGNGTQ